MISLWQKTFEDFLNKNETFDDASHDINHFRRVWKIAQKLAKETDDLLVILAACYFHDIVNYPKDDPRRSMSSLDASIKTIEIFKELGFPEDKISHVGHCIHAHSFSAGIIPETREAKIVQDADRMESLGAIGLARVFYVGGRMGRPLFDSNDPLAKQRELDDRKYCVDHFYTKLLKLPLTMQTAEGREEGLKRLKVLEKFLIDLNDELQSL